jgi:8-oxo-dGTP pyrophosphatase MutT (NUDIX family)
MTMLTFDDVRRALRQPLPGLPAQLRMSPPGRVVALPAGVSPRDAGVLVLLYPIQGELHFVLTRRNDRLGNHSGQISFPGGRREPADVDIAATALREANEELGILSAGIEVIGELTQLYVPPSNFVIHPIVAFAQHAPAFTPQPDEVAEVIEVKLRRLLDPSIKHAVSRPLLSLNGQVVMAPAYRLAGHDVWGATAMVLSELEALLRSALEG